MSTNMIASSKLTFYTLLIVLTQVCQIIEAVPSISRSANFTKDYSNFKYPSSELTSHPRKLTKREEALIRKVITHELENKTILNAVSNILSTVRKAHQFN